jgi:hypothetical protein
MKKTLIGISLISSIILLTAGCTQELPIQVKPIEKPQPVIAKVVGITGAAGELKRLTYGGHEELVSSLSNDKEWLLLDTYSLDKGKRSNNIIQKLSLKTGAKMILTPANSVNQGAVWSNNDKSIIFTTKRSGSAIVESMGVDGENGVKFITNNSLDFLHNPKKV